MVNRGNLTLRDDWITAGTASSGGGVSNQGGTMVVTHSLVSGNTASSGRADSGGIQNYGDNSVGAASLAVRDSTIAYNDGGSRNGAAGGLLVSQGTIAVQNSIVAHNTVGNGASASDCGATGITSLGHNLESGTDCGFSASG